MIGSGGENDRWIAGRSCGLRVTVVGLRAMVILGITLVAMSGGVAGKTKIGECQTVTQSGTHLVLDSDIGSTTEYCIEVAADDILIDGNEHMITGENSSSAILVQDSTNITIQNLTVVGHSQGTPPTGSIHIRDSSKITIIDNSFEDNAISIGVVRSPKGNITRNEISGSVTWGVILWNGSDRFILSNNRFNGNKIGVKISESSDILIEGNTMIPEIMGVFSINGNRMNIRENGIMFPGEERTKQAGVVLSSDSTNNEVRENKITNGSMAVQVAWDSNNNIISHNTASGSKFGVHMMYSRELSIESNNFESGSAHLSKIGGQPMSVRLEDLNHTVTSNASAEISINNVAIHQAKSPISLSSTARIIGPSVKVSTPMIPCRKRANPTVEDTTTNSQSTHDSEDQSSCTPHLTLPYRRSKTENNNSTAIGLWGYDPSTGDWAHIGGAADPDNRTITTTQPLSGAPADGWVVVPVESMDGQKRSEAESGRQGEDGQEYSEEGEEQNGDEFQEGSAPPESSFSAAEKPVLSQFIDALAESGRLIYASMNHKSLIADSLIEELAAKFVR